MSRAAVWSSSSSFESESSAGSSSGAATGAGFKLGFDVGFAGVAVFAFFGGVPELGAAAWCEHRFLP